MTDSHVLQLSTRRSANRKNAIKSVRRVVQSSSLVNYVLKLDRKVNWHLFPNLYVLVCSFIIQKNNTVDEFIFFVKENEL